MKLNSGIHGAIDYGIVMFLLISPLYFRLAGITSYVTYALGIIHLLLTVSTKFELGIFRIISFRIHGMIELGIVMILIGLSAYLGNLEGNLSRYYYISFAVIIFMTWLMTDYKNLPKNQL